MYRVAIVAGHLVVLVLAAIPVGAGGALVAVQALGGANPVVGCIKCVLLENDIRCGVWVVQVLFAFTVAALTARRAGITPDTVLGLVDGKNRRRFAFIVAARANRVPFQ